MGFTANRSVKTTERTFDIIERLAESPATVSAIAASLDANRGIVHNHLSTLRERGYVIKDEDQYRLSPKTFELGAITRSQFRSYSLARSHLDDIAARFDTVGLLFGRHQDFGTVMYVTDDSSVLPRPLRLGQSTHLTESLYGVSLLSELPPDRRESIEESAPDAIAYDRATVSEVDERTGMKIGQLTANTDVRGVSLPIQFDRAIPRCAACVAFLGEPDERTETDIASALRQIFIEASSSGEEEETSKRTFATLKHEWSTG